MKFSESWLREWVNPALTSEELAHQITMAGLEVDEVCDVAGSFSEVVVGEVIECSQHPDADKLRVTKVDVGSDELLDIVCGAPNCRQGLKVAVAVVGAVLPGDFKIKKAKLRGQPSHGMLCSFSELGIDIDANGIIELPSDAVVGTDIRAFLQLNDKTIDVDLTPNRADCLSIRGLAREVGVLNRIDVKLPEYDCQSITCNDEITISIEAPHACPRYIGRIIRNLNVKAVTPLWMQEKLRRSGIRSIDPVVDVTNYVMLELGQPMHAFDLSKIEGGIKVRMAKQNEKLVLLDANEVTLTPETLVIADQNKALAMAGIFGGLHSGVTASTTDVLLESAFFTPAAIRGRARNYGLHTDSSHRFERGVDWTLQEQAMERATQLLVEICGGQVSGLSSMSIDEALPKQEPIRLRREKLDKLLGHVISNDDVYEILNRLGCNVNTGALDWSVTAPSWRFDLAIEEDLIEEVGRIFGYDNIPNQKPFAALDMHGLAEKYIPTKRIRDLLVDRGFHEAITYSFVEPEKQKLIVPNIEPLILPNPISADMSAMRLSLLPGLLNTAVHNQKRQQGRVRIFESGLRFIPDQESENGIKQETMLAALITGSVSDEHWNLPTNTVDFFDLKGDLEAILALTGKQDAFSFSPAQHPALHPGQTATIELNGNVVGFIGTLHPELERKFSLNGRTIVFEIEWAAISQRDISQVESLSKYPVNRRDIAVVVDASLESDAVLKACLESGNQIVSDARLFDVYQGEHLGENMKSLAIALTMQSREKTLEEHEMQEAMNSVISLLQEKFSATLRS